MSISSCGCFIEAASAVIPIFNFLQWQITDKLPHIVPIVTPKYAYDFVLLPVIVLGTEFDLMNSNPKVILFV